MNIKPIETVYNGYRFRSRLEARWAVFFDRAGIEYTYEPDGFDLGEFGWYLPDFYLPWFKCYLEIKPKGYIGIDEAKNKLWKLFEQKSDCCCMICLGDPVDNNMTVLCQEISDDGGGLDEFSAQFLEGVWWSDETGQYGTTKHWISLVLDTHKSRKFFDYNWNILPLEQSFMMWFYRSDFDYAKVAARQSRFEHGEYR